MTQRLLRLLLCLPIFCLISLQIAIGQQRSPFNNLLTAINTPVYEQISGLNLDVNKSSPQAKHGAVSVSVLTQGGSGNPYVFQVKYVPDPGFVGVDSFVLEYRYASTYPYLVYQGFRVSVMPSLVVAETDYAISNNGSPVLIDVLANDSGAWGPLNVSFIASTNNGSAVIESNNKIRFIPEQGFTGIAHAQYTVCDALNTCQTGTIHVGVNNGLPDSQDQQLFTKENQPIEIPLDFAGYVVSDSPDNGDLNLLQGKALLYTPGAGFSGNDQFTLKATVNGNSYYKTFKVKVYAQNKPNVMAIDDFVVTSKNTPVTFNVRRNDIGNLLVRNWSVPNNFPGTLSGNNGIGDVTFTPNPGFSGVATFTYKIGNSSAPAIETATVTILVDNLAPPEVFPYRLTTPIGTPFVLKYDIPLQYFNFSVLEAPEHGTVNILQGAGTQTLNGQDISDKAVALFTPDPGFTGFDHMVLNYCTPNGACQSTKIDLEVVALPGILPPFCSLDCTWPGDMDGDGITNNKDLLSLGYAMGQSGLERLNANTNWYGQYAENWDMPFLGLSQDLKLLDADGNGRIDVADMSGIYQSYNKVNNLFPAPYRIDKGLPFSLKLLTPSPKKGDLVKLEISLGDDQYPALDIYGFMFNMKLSQGIIDSAFKMTYYDNSWLNLNAPNINLVKRPATGKFETAFSRTNGHPVSGQGVIGSVEFIIIDIVDGGGQNNRPSFTFDPSFTLSDGSSWSANPITLELPSLVEDRTAVENAGIDIKVYPSPATQRLMVEWPISEKTTELCLIDAQGRVVARQVGLAGNTTSFDVSSLPSGLYIVSLQHKDRVIAKKVQVLH